LDTLNPTVTVDIVDTSLNDADNSSEVTFEFSEEVAGFEETDLTVVGGTISGFTKVDGDSYTATYTAADGFDGQGSVTARWQLYRPSGQPGGRGFGQRRHRHSQPHGDQHGGE